MKLIRTVVAVDPAVTANASSDETGIIVAGKGDDGRYYVLDDESCRLSPDGWANRALDCYYEWDASRLVAEVNNGGDLVERVIRTLDTSVSYKAVRASRGKVSRAEPVAALYEQGKVVHIRPFPDLEDQMCNFVPGEVGNGLDDRVDALTWAITELMDRGHNKRMVYYPR